MRRWRFFTALPRSSNDCTSAISVDVGTYRSYHTSTPAVIKAGLIGFHPWVEDWELFLPLFWKNRTLVPYKYWYHGTGQLNRAQCSQYPVLTISSPIVMRTHSEMAVGLKCRPAASSQLPKEGILSWAAPRSLPAPCIIVPLRDSVPAVFFLVFVSRFPSHTRVASLVASLHACTEASSSEHLVHRRCL